MTYSIVTLPDGAKLAYNVFGAENLHHAEPIVLVGGMSSTRGDWERLSTALSSKRPVLVFDHRGMGDSTESSSDRDDDITTESMARDLTFLLQSLGWKNLSICGFSMGGVITQEILLLPYHPSEPTPLPFRITHALLTGTLASTFRDKRYGLPLAKRPEGPLSLEQKRELARPILEATFDPAWVSDGNNSERFQWWLERMTTGRPMRTIMRQGITLLHINFENRHSRIPRDTQVLVIHGEIDSIVPFYSGQEVLRLIPHARIVEIGNRPGQIPSYQFGHHWWEYFDIKVWQDVVELFLDNESKKVKAQL